MGDHPTVHDDGSLQPVFRRLGANSLRWRALSNLELHCARAVDILRYWFIDVVQQPRWQRQSDQESVFPASDHPHRDSPIGRDRLRDRLRSTHPDDAGVRYPADYEYHLSAVLRAAGVCDVTGRRFVAQRNERPISRRALHDPVPHAVLDVRNSYCLSKQPDRKRNAARYLRHQSDDRGGRRVPVGAARHRQRARSSDYRFVACGAVPVRQRSVLFPSHGKILRGCGVIKMSDIAIRVENLGKLYRIGGPQEKYTTLRDTITSAATAPIRKIRGLLRGESASDLKEEIWALKDVSFDVKHGEVVGIIGRNGAGKSTLLKILSRITEPTTGYADVYGRVGALLEVGTGFHPELTGRENVYLNGAILGMSRRDIDRKFDEIIEFAGIEKFVDTPVKHYSSGMGLRLGFAVAAHLEPEILVVDEVLAVGDAEFQKKCLGKMSTVANNGRTVLFVSHNMAAVSALCSSAIYLEAGQVRVEGNTRRIIQQYISLFDSLPETRLATRTDRTGNGIIRFTNVRTTDSKLDQRRFTTQTGAPLSLIIEYESVSGETPHKVDVAIVFHDSLQRPLFTCSTEWFQSLENLPPRGAIRCDIGSVPLLPGRYPLLISGIADGVITDRIENAVVLDVESGDFFETGRLPYNVGKHGHVAINHTWALMDDLPQYPPSHFI